MISKVKLLAHISKMPNEISIDELIDKLVFIDKLEKRIVELDNDETISEEALENSMNQWFK